MISSTTPEVIPFDLERLYEDQAKSWLRYTIPAVLAWVPVPAKDQHDEPQPFRFDIAYAPQRGGAEKAVEVALRWDIAELKRHEPDIVEQAEELRTGQTALREHVVELAAYGLAFVAISLFLPGRRVKAMRKGSPPDILLDATPGALRGVEVAGLSEGGRPALRARRVGSKKVLGKADQLLAMDEVVEAHLSLWCREPRVSEMFKVKP